MGFIERLTSLKETSYLFLPSILVVVWVVCAVFGLTDISALMIVFLMLAGAYLIVNMIVLVKLFLQGRYLAAFMLVLGFGVAFLSYGVAIMLLFSIALSS